MNKKRIEGYFEAVRKKITYSILQDRAEDGLYELRVDELRTSDTPLTIEEIDILLAKLRADGCHTAPTTVSGDIDCVLISDLKGDRRLYPAIRQLRNLILSPEVSQVVYLAKMIKRGALISDLMELD